MTAAGVFILLSMTGWAAAKRLMKQIREKVTPGRVAGLVGTSLAALLTTGATALIFEERFFEGAWTYLLFIPLLYGAFGYYRNRLGEPMPVADHLGRLLSGHYLLPFQREPGFEEVVFEKVLVPLDGSAFGEQALPVARNFAHRCGAEISLYSVKHSHDGNGAPTKAAREERGVHQSEDLDQYLGHVAGELVSSGIWADVGTGFGPVPEAIDSRASEIGADLIVLCTRARSGLESWLESSISAALIRRTSTPVLVLRPTESWRSRSPEFRRLLVTLDGSEFAESVLPYARAVYTSFGSEIILLLVPEGAQSGEARLREYLESVATALREQGYQARGLVTGSGPARTILSVSESESTDLILMASHGLGGPQRIEHGKVGSVAARVVQKTVCAVLVVHVRAGNQATRQPSLPH